MVTKFVLNKILYHVGMSWIIRSDEEMKYEMEENNHQDLLIKGPWYNTAICLRLHGGLFEYFITHVISDRYTISCFLVAHDKIQPYYKNDESSIGDRSITKNISTEALV